MMPAFEEIRTKNEELADVELWNTESLCFNYYNILQQYKALKQVSIVTICLGLNSRSLLYVFRTGLSGCDSADQAPSTNRNY